MLERKRGLKYRGVTEAGDRQGTHERLVFQITGEED